MRRNKKPAEKLSFAATPIYRDGPLKIITSLSKTLGLYKKQYQQKTKQNFFTARFHHEDPRK